MTAVAMCALGVGYFVLDLGRGLSGALLLCAILPFSQYRPDRAVILVIISALFLGIITILRFSEFTPLSLVNLINRYGFMNQLSALHYMQIFSVETPNGAIIAFLQEFPILRRFFEGGNEEALLFAMVTSGGKGGFAIAPETISVLSRDSFLVSIAELSLMYYTYYWVIYLLLLRSTLVAPLLVSLLPLLIMNDSPSTMIFIIILVIITRGYESLLAFLYFQFPAKSFLNVHKKGYIR